MKHTFGSSHSSHDADSGLRWYFPLIEVSCGAESPQVSLTTFIRGSSPASIRRPTGNGKLVEKLH